MAVYYDDFGNMVADTLTELHEFAESIGITREGFFYVYPNTSLREESSGFLYPHYDITHHAYLVRAVKLGAKHISTRIAGIIGARLLSEWKKEENRKSRKK